MSWANLSGMAALLLGHGGWPLVEEAAVGVIERFFLGKCGTAHEKRKLMKKLGLPESLDAFPLALAREHATLQARAALAELQSLDLIETKEVGPGGVVDTRFTALGEPRPRGRYMLYRKTENGRKALAELATRGRLSASLQEEGWP